jgi:hypothetical protein
MSNFRFGLMVAVAFALTFIGVWLGTKSGPVMAMRSAPAKPEAPAPVAAVVEPSPQPTVRKDAEPPKPEPRTAAVVPPKPAPIKPASRPAEVVVVETDKDRGRMQIRRTAIQAAQAYAISPCDQATKAAFVVATTTYVKAMTEATGDQATAVKAFATPMDARVREAVQQAFAAGGVSKDDFPANAQVWVATTAQPRRDGVSPCGVGRTAERAPH